MTKKEKSAVEEYMARPDLPEALKAANREFVGAPDDWVSAIEENATKAAPLAAELAKWQALAQSPWEAPAGLLESVATLERDYPVTLSLALAIDLMAFGAEAAPASESTSGRLEAGARRRRARQALLDAAGQAKFPLEHGPDCMPIKPGRFKFIQGPGLDGDSLEFNDLKEGEPEKRLQVVQIVEAGKFYEWLGEQAGVPTDILPYAVASEELPRKSQIALEAMKSLYGHHGIPMPESMPKLAKDLTVKYRKLGWVRLNTRGKQIAGFNVEDVERVFGRRK